MKRKKNHLRLVVTLLIGLCLAVGVFASRSGFDMSDWPDIAAALCDACFAPAALLISFGLLLFASNDGLFDMMAFSVQKVLRLVLGAEKQAAFPKTFYDYRVLRQGKAKAGFGFLLIAGAVYLALAFIFLLCSGAV